MRRLASIGLALLELVLVVPAAARGGSERHLCPRCQMLEAQRQAGGAPVAIPDARPVPGCAACAAMAGGPAMTGAPVRIGSEPPGVASLGGGAQVISGEPVPIDVVRASYAQQVPPVGPAPGMARPIGMAGAAGPTLPPGPVGWVPKPARRPSVLAYLFGLDGLGQRRRDRAEQAASAHAAMPLGQPGGMPVSDLPASVVYGR